VAQPAQNFGGPNLLALSEQQSSASREMRRSLAIIFIV